MVNDNEKKPASAMMPYFLLLVPPLCLGGNAVVARGVVGVVPPVSLAFWRWVLAFFILLPFTLGHVKRDWKRAVRSWKWMLILWNRGLELIGANRAGLFSYLVPVFASVMAILFLGETLQGYHVMGMALIIVGMVIFNRRG